MNLLKQNCKQCMAELRTVPGDEIFSFLGFSICAFFLFYFFIFPFYAICIFGLLNHLCLKLSLFCIFPIDCEE